MNTVSMDDIIARLKARRNTLELSFQDLADLTGMSKSTLQRYESGAIKNIPLSRVEDLASALQTTPEYLMGWTETSEKLPKNILPMPHTHKIPVIGTIACGTPILAEQNIDGFEPCPDYVHADFCLHCKGDSMINARINDGDTVFIHKQPLVENGEIAAIEIFDGGECEATLKRFYHNGNTVTLVAENPAYPPMTFSNEQINNIKVIGKATYFVSAIK